MSKYKSELDHMEYRLDLLERRLNKMEDILLSSSQKTPNNELMTLLVSMIKDQYTTPHAQRHEPCKPDAPRKSVKEDKNEEGANTDDESYNSTMARRRLIF